MDQAAPNQSQAPRTSQADEDGAIEGSGTSEAVTRLLKLMKEMKGNIGLHLDRIEARQGEGDQAMVVSGGSGTASPLKRMRALESAVA